MYTGFEYIGFDDAKYKQTRLLKEKFKVKQTKIASRLIQGQANMIKKKIRP